MGIMVILGVEIRLGEGPLLMMLLLGEGIGDTGSIVVSLSQRLVVHLVGVHYRVVVHGCRWWRIEKGVDMADRLVR